MIQEVDTGMQQAVPCNNNPWGQQPTLKNVKAELMSSHAAGRHWWTHFPGFCGCLNVPTMWWQKGMLSGFVCFAVAFLTVHLQKSRLIPSKYGTCKRMTYYYRLPHPPCHWKKGSSVTWPKKFELRNATKLVYVSRYRNMLSGGLGVVGRDHGSMVLSLESPDVQPYRGHFRLPYCVEGCSRVGTVGLLSQTIISGPLDKMSCFYIAGHMLIALRFCAFSQGSFSRRMVISCTKFCVLRRMEE